MNSCVDGKTSKGAVVWFEDVLGGTKTRNAGGDERSLTDLANPG